MSRRQSRMGQRILERELFGPEPRAKRALLTRPIAIPPEPPRSTHGKVADLSFMLTHLTWLDERGGELGFGCRRPKIEHVADPCAHTVDQLAARPTCPQCAVMWDRLGEVQRAASR